jgi:hypothetical protein
MPTANVIVTREWTQVAVDSDAGFLASSADGGFIQYATTTAATAPTVEGHLVPQMTLVGRGLIGPGIVWARVLPPDASSVLVVTKL